ncbi:MAG: AAA family ATPase [Chloroflexi bacterium]|nr:AAA family ATPase [Chloroflexota bacterium]MCI0579875.1 AAA family ATPase [Chloroflexota bacterium]MCI0646156.1 AAA family ATPase [Chloroflexota bacterium]MCI0729866.1 AAA family ATPase [Chloroflexota bacterium]
MATRMICVANQKGGVGKTTTAVNLAYGLAQAGKKTLLVDLDPQANTTVAVLGQDEPELTTYDLLARDQALANVIAETGQPRLFLLPSEIDLAGVEAELLGQVGSQTLLRSIFRKSLKSGYDYVVIDTPPSLGLLTLNALAASTEVVIPVSASFFALKGIAQLERTISLVRDRLDCPDLRIGGVVCTLYDHTNVARDVYQAIQRRFGDRTFKAVIPKNVKVEEAHSRSLSLYDYAPQSSGAQAYKELVEEVIGRG